MSPILNLPTLELNTVRIAQLEIITGEKTNKTLPLSIQRKLLYNKGLTNGTIITAPAYDIHTRIATMYFSTL